MAHLEMIYIDLWCFAFQQNLVGGLEHVLFFHIIGNNNNPNWLIFFRGVETTNQNGDFP